MGMGTVTGAHTACRFLFIAIERCASISNSNGNGRQQHPRRQQQQQQQRQQHERQQHQPQQKQRVYLLSLVRPRETREMNNINNAKPKIRADTDNALNAHTTIVIEIQSSAKITSTKLLISETKTLDSLVE